MNFIFCKFYNFIKYEIFIQNNFYHRIIANDAINFIF